MGHMACNHARQQKKESKTMKPQHTPAPWYATPDNKAIYTKDGIGYRLDTICRVTDGNKATVRLIAAAPDLLDAALSIENLRELFQNGARDGALMGQISSAMDKMHAAINKAKGL